MTKGIQIKKERERGEKEKQKQTRVVKRYLGDLKIKRDF